MVPPLQVRASVRTLSEGIRYKIDTFSDVFAFNIFAPSSTPYSSHTHVWCGTTPSSYMKSRPPENVVCAVGLAPAAVRIAQFCPYSLVFVGEDTNRGRVGFRFRPGDGSAAPAAAATTRKQSLLAYAWSAVPLVFRVVSSRCLPPTREFVYVCMGGRGA